VNHPAAVTRSHRVLISHPLREEIINVNKLYSASLAAAFGAVSTLAVLAGGTQQPASNHQNFFSSAPTIALADRDEHGGNSGNNEDNQGNQGNNGNSHGCENPAGHQRGWCKHHGDNEDNGGGRHHRGRGTVLSGTVQNISGNTVTFLRDNGQLVTINDNNGTPLTKGQHYSLRVYSENGQYVLAPTNNNNGGGQYGNQSVSGTIALVSGNTLTFTNGRTIDISQVNGNTNGPLTTLRNITAYGYVSNNVFYARYIR